MYNPKKYKTSCLTSSKGPKGKSMSKTIARLDDKYGADWKEGLKPKRPFLQFEVE